MKTDRYLWSALWVLFCSLGMHVLLDSMRHAGPHAEEYVLLGATLTALGLATLGIRFGQYRQRRAMARHLRRPHFSGRSRGTDNS
jgi:hypothetical protein